MKYDHWNRAHPPGIYQIDCACQAIHIVETPQCFGKVEAPDEQGFDFTWRCPDCKEKFKPEWTRKLRWVRVSEVGECLKCLGLKEVNGKKCHWCEGRGSFGF